MADEKSHYAKYDQRTNKKMAEHNREGGDVRKPVRKVEGASAKDKRDRARFAFRKATQALKANHPLKDEKGRPTPAAMQFKRWGFAVPQDRSDLAKLKAFGKKHMQSDDVKKAFADAKERIEKIKPKGVSEKEWQDGVAHESEHADVAPAKKTQAKIAAAHLKEDPKYYSKLKRAGIK